MTISTDNHVILRRVREHPETRNRYRTFAYDPEGQEFILNGVRYPEAEVKDIKRLKDGKDLSDEEIINAPVLLDLSGSPLGGVAMDRWVKKPRSTVDLEKISFDVISVMSEFFQREYLREKRTPFFDSSNPKLLEVGDHIVFGFYIRPDIFAGLDFQVMGNCACLGNQFPSRYSGKEHEGVFMYGFHNVDSGFQKKALYAGLGYVAGLAEEPNQ